MKNRTSFTYEFRALGDLLGYFHQDWAGTPDEVIGRYKNESEIELTRRVVKDIDSLLAKGMAEDQLKEALLKLGCAYGPDLDGWLVSNWLSHVRERLSEE